MLRNKLTLLKPDVEQRILCKQEDAIKNSSRRKLRTFAIHEKVFARTYRTSLKWIPGIISKKTGPVSYEIAIEGGTIRRHVDQIIPCSTFNNFSSSHESYEDHDLDEVDSHAEQIPQPQVTAGPVDSTLPFVSTEATNTKSPELSHEPTYTDSNASRVTGSESRVSECSNNNAEAIETESANSPIVEAECKLRRSVRQKRCPDRFQSGSP